MTDEPPQQQPQDQPRSSAPRQQSRPQHRHYREQRQRSPGGQSQAPPSAQAPAETKESRIPGLDDADTEEETATRPSQPRGHRGRPERKKYEEWANDPYCN